MSDEAVSYEPPVSCKVYTPAKLAAAMIAAVGAPNGGRWLEPSVGHGVFLRELHKLGVLREQITAVDLEPTPHAADVHARVHRGVDFLDWCHSTQERFDRIAANPPYVSLLDLPYHARAIARSLELPSGNGRLPARSNLWAAFLIGTIRLLNEGGNLTFVLPAAWDYADYAAELRDALPKLFAEWICLRCEEPLFPTVQEGSIVLVGRGYKRPHVLESRVSCLRLDDLTAQLQLLGGKPISTLVTGRKTTPVTTEAGQPLSDFVDIRLGGVTGDAAYFLLTESRRQELELPTIALRPVLSKASHLRSAFVDRLAWEKLRDDDARVWLFRPSRAALKNAQVKKYLRLDRKNGGCDKQAGKVKNRKLWHRVPLPRGVDGFISGMSNAGPWIALSAYADLTATNTLYTIHFRGKRSKAYQAKIALSLLTSAVRAQLKSLCRRYAAGLAKFEPGDLQAVVIPNYDVHGDAAVEYRKAVRALLEGNLKEATDIADQCLRVAPITDTTQKTPGRSN